MKTLLTLLSLLICSTSLAGTMQVNSVNVGGGPYDGVASGQLVTPTSDLASRRSLVASTTSLNPGNYYRLVRMGQQTTNGENYQVGASATLYCNGFWYVTSNANVSFLFGYGTTAVANNSSTPPSGEKDYGPTFNSLQTGGTTGEWKWYPFFMSFPSSSFPFIVMNGTATNPYRTVLDCIEK